jgi:hypothetical protein
MASAGTTTVQAEIKDLERQYWEASKKPDHAAIERLTADTFTFVMEDGITNFSRQEFVDMLRSGDYKLKSFSISDDNLTVREISPGVALCAYRATSDYEYQGKPARRDAYYAATWLRKGGSWELTAESETVRKA